MSVFNYNPFRMKLHREIKRENPDDVRLVYSISNAWRAMEHFLDPMTIMPKQELKNGEIPITRHMVRLITLNPIHVLTVVQTTPSLGDLMNLKVNFHKLEERDQIQFTNWTKTSLMEYMVLANQNIQIDPVVTHLRLLAKLAPQGTGTYEEILNLINQIKKKVADIELTASTLFQMLKWILIGETPLHQLVNKFFQMLLTNQTLEYKIGPPTMAIEQDRLQGESLIWTTYYEITRLQITFQAVADNSNQRFPTNGKFRIDWYAGKTKPYQALIKLK